MLTELQIKNITLGKSKVKILSLQEGRNIGTVMYKQLYSHFYPPRFLVELPNKSMVWAYPYDLELA